MAKWCKRNKPAAKRPKAAMEAAYQELWEHMEYDDDSTIVGIFSEEIVVKYMIAKAKGSL